jgi:hypothetical protein
MKVLLLGGTGYVGSNLVTQRPNWSWTTVGSGQCNLLDKNSISDIQGKYDVVINVAGFYGGIVFNQRGSMPEFTNINSSWTESGVFHQTMKLPLTSKAILTIRSILLIIKKLV